MGLHVFQKSVIEHNSWNNQKDVHMAAAVRH